VTKRQRGTRRPPAPTTPSTNTQSGAAASGGAGGTAPSSDSTSAGGTRVTGTPPARVSGSTVTSRSARRRARTTPVSRNQSFLERYRNVLLIAFAIIGVGVIALVFYQSANAKPWICSSLLTPGPVETLPPATPSPATTAAPSAAESPAATGSPSTTASPVAPTSVASPTSPAASGLPATAGSPDPSESPAATASPATAASPAATVSPAASPESSPSPSVSPSPVPEPTVRLGFTTKDLGRTHVAVGSTVTYGFCPPTSGNHYSDPGAPAPLPRNFYDPTKSLKPQQWVHNLEHGYVVLLYKGTPDQATLDSLKKVFDTASPPSDGFAAQCGQPNRVIAVRFDDMDTPFALVAWDRALLLPQWDFDQALTFANQWQDGPAIPESPSSGGGVC